MELLSEKSASIGFEARSAVQWEWIRRWLERGLQERSEIGYSTSIPEFQRISVARAWLGNPLVLALTHLAFDVSVEIPVKIQVAAPGSWVFQDAGQFFLPEVIAALRVGVQEMLSRRLPVWTSQVWLLFWLESGTSTPEPCFLQGNAAV